jgi:hypothetical protein
VTARRVLVIAAVAVLLAVFLVAGDHLLHSDAAPRPAAASEDLAAPVVRHWLIEEYAATELSRTAVGARFVRAIDNPSTYEIVTRHVGPDVLPKAVHIDDFDSYQAISAAFSRGALPAGVQGILYDDERWPGTPLTEQQHPFLYVRQAAALAHERGLIFISTPAPDLSTSIEPAHHGNYSGYLQEKLGSLAQQADVFDVQAQHESTVAGYITFAKAAAAQARKANPHVVVLLGITTNRETSPDLIAEVDGTQTVAGGYWLNVIGGSTGVSTAVPLLASLGY